VSESGTDEEIIVVWQSQGQDGSGFGIFGRGFDSSGVPDDGGEAQINVVTADNQVGPVFRFLRDEQREQLVVVWSSNLQDGDQYGVFGRSIDQRGNFSEDEFSVNVTTPFVQRAPQIAGAGQRFVVVWHSALQDGSQLGVFARRFVLPLTLDIDGDGEIQPLTDGLLVLRYEFGFRGATLVTGVVGSSCTRCDAPTIEEYLGSV
jgi:hypothetical protein